MLFWGEWQLLKKALQRSKPTPVSCCVGGPGRLSEHLSSWHQTSIWWKLLDSYVGQTLHFGRNEKMIFLLSNNQCRARYSKNVIYYQLLITKAIILLYLLLPANSNSLHYSLHYFKFTSHKISSCVCHQNSDVCFCVNVRVIIVKCS